MQSYEKSSIFVAMREELMNLRHSCYLLLALASVLSCKAYDDDTPCVDRTNGRQYALYDIYIDVYGNKGIVVQDYYSEGVLETTYKRVLVMSLDETQTTWGQANDYFEQLPKEKAIYYRNSVYPNQAAVEYGLENYPSFEWCLAKNKLKRGEVPGFGDWMLPGRYEMELLSENLETINTRLLEMGDSLIDGYYWCSDSYSKDNAVVWNSSDGKSYYTNKGKEFRVRAFCYIYLK